MKKQISCIEIDINGKCDFQCDFCYFTKKQAIKKKFLTNTDNTPLSFKEITALILQAGQLGAQEVFLFTQFSSPFVITDHSDSKAESFNNGPLFNMVHDVIDFVHTQNMQVKVVTHETLPDIKACSPGDINCRKHQFSCFVTSRGIVYPCAGMPLPIGNLRKDPLKKIINNSEILENLKNHTKMIKGPCRECQRFAHCHGCRGRAFAYTGDYLASDPMCSQNKDKSDRICSLPMSVENLIPQKAGMRVVSTLLEIGERYAAVESLFSDKSPFVKKDGSLEEIIYMEIMAQSAAVMDGFAKFDTDAPEPRGFLTGGQQIKIYMKACCGEKLRTDIYKTMRFGNFGMLLAKIKRGDDLIAEGEIKIYQFDDGNNSHEADL